MDPVIRRSAITLDKLIEQVDETLKFYASIQNYAAGRTHHGLCLVVDDMGSRARACQKALRSAAPRGDKNEFETKRAEIAPG